MTWFLSMPMNGLSTEQIMEKRSKLMEDIWEIDPDGEIINSIVEDYEGKPALDCLGESISMLAYCDAMIRAIGWKSSKGCVIETMCADFYGISIYNEVE